MNEREARDKFFWHLSHFEIICASRAFINSATMENDSSVIRLYLRSWHEEETAYS